MNTAEKELIKSSRTARVLKLMEANCLDAVLVNNCSIGNLNTWLLAKDEMPLHLPFNRNNLCYINRSGKVTELCAREPHPCDWSKYPLITETDLSDDLKDGRLGLVNPSYLKKVVRDDLAGKYNVTFVDINNDFHLLMTEKSLGEIEGMISAAEQFDRAFTTIPMILTGEHTEREVAVQIRNRFRQLGAECEDLQSSCMLRLTSAPCDGESVPEPIMWPGRRITWGDRINISVNGFMKGGFASALSRTFIIGTPSDENVTYWNMAVDAQHLIAENAVPGTTVRKLMDIFTEQILDPAGLSPVSCNQIYGIGAGITEAPRNMDATCDLPLSVGMTLVIAPVIAPDGKDPYCLGDVFVVTRDGAVRLSKTPQDLYILD